MLFFSGLEALQTSSKDALFFSGTRLFPSWPGNVRRRQEYGVSSLNIKFEPIYSFNLYSVMLAGRALQDVGLWVILSLVEIVLADLLSLSERYITFS